MEFRDILDRRETCKSHLMLHRETIPTTKSTLGGGWRALLFRSESEWDRHPSAHTSLRSTWLRLLSSGSKAHHRRVVEREECGSCGENWERPSAPNAQPTPCALVDQHAPTNMYVLQKIKQLKLELVALPRLFLLLHFCLLLCHLLGHHVRKVLL